MADPRYPASEPPKTLKPLYVRTSRVIHGDFPFGMTTWVGPGLHKAALNQYGAVAVIAENGEQLGLKPLEFSWACPCGGAVWDERQWRECRCDFAPPEPSC